MSVDTAPAITTASAAAASVSQWEARLQRASNFEDLALLASNIAACESEECALAHMTQASSALGADAAVFVTYARDEIHREAFKFMLACSRRWCAEYEQVSTFAQHPWLVYALGYSTPICSSELAIVSETQRQALEVPKAYGFTSSLVVPAPSARPGARVGVLVLGSKTPGFYEHEAAMRVRFTARGVAGELNDWWTRHEANALCERCDLTDLDKQLLADTALGLSSKDIRRARGLSTHAVDSRLQRVIAKLGVASRREAARVLYRHAIIDTPC